MLLKRLRKKLTGKDHLKKYLLYAIGEIVIVVSGILLAVQLNNWNETRKDRDQLEAIHKILATDIQQDIAEIQLCLDFYEERAPYFKKILLDSMTVQLFQNCDVCFSLISSYYPISLNKKGYSLLEEQANFNEKDTLDIHILELYNGFVPLIESNQNQIKNDILSNLNYWKVNYPWMANIFMRELDPDFFNYALESPDYKNRVALHYTLAYQNHKIVLEVFKAKLEKINEVLNRDHTKQ